MAKETKSEPSNREVRGFSPPAISLPKGGGAVRGIGEKFAANPVTGTGSMTVPIATSPGRVGFGPQLSLSYDSGSGNGPFGVGWSLGLPSITRKTDKGLPRYWDAEESDVFILSGAEDLVPAMKQDDHGRWVPDEFERDAYAVKRYSPRIEGLFARIERWTNIQTNESHWRSISRDNITTLYGMTAESRIKDPVDSTRIFCWLICATYDDKGNAIIYEYAEENDHNVDRTKASERNRARAANRYLKRIKYGNRTPNRDGATWQATDPAQLPAETWIFEVVFDYGEGHYAEDAPDSNGRVFAQAGINPPASSHWPVRQDPSSTYRAGFEVRTYRLCRRVLMFHHFPQELGIDDCLVRSTEFSYSESPVASFITGITQSGYVRKPVVSQPNRYLKRSLPPVEFEYSQVPSPEQLARHPIREVDTQSLANLPVGLDGSHYQWVDLDGEGLSGILTEQADGWYYKRNLSANNLVKEDGRERAVARFGPVEIVADKPVADLGDQWQLLDLAGDGQVDLVQMSGPLRGFYERTEDAGWVPFKPFGSWPDLNTHDPNLRFIDLSGDGHADILITEGDSLIWYPSLSEEGFGQAVRVRLSSDEEKGPQLVFSDAAHSVYLADLSGDGLSDLVRIRNGEVCYWPNLGYGNFGPKVTMDNAPWFDSSDQFDQRRIRLADTDGSGTTDILYLRHDGARIYFNQSGNSWSEAVALPQFPPLDNVSSVQAADLLGNGTACLVWSSPLPDAARQPMRYLTLMEEKPHLLAAVKNNLGAETRVHYAPSTMFYLADKEAGRPWITRLPFPVHVVERIETFDRISRNRFTTRYEYHHGYFDGVEREFRGFGLVEQFDTEALAVLSDSDAFPAGDNIDATSHVPPVHAKTWFHTGAYLGRDHVSDFFAGLMDANDRGEYYREPGLNDEQARKLLLEDTALPAGLSVEEEREACRALKGSMLRQEIYALDGSEKEKHPYTVTEQNFTVELLQPQTENRHAVFFTHSREVITYHYERDPADPRISHALTLEVDSYGNALKESAISYGRRHPDPEMPLQADRDKQTATLITYTENRFTNPINDPGTHPDDYRAPLPAETRTYELTGFKPKNAAARFSFDEWVENDFELPSSALEIAYEESADTSKKQKRPVEHVRTIYRKNDLTGLLPLGTVESLGLQGESYKLAFTPGLLTNVYQRPHDSAPTENLLPNPADVLGGTGGDRGGYVVSQDLKSDGVFPSTDPNNHWWIPSGRVFLSANTTHTATQELDQARHHFFLQLRYRDPFRQNSTVAYDAYDLLMIETEDSLGNRITVGERDAAGNITRKSNDYRVLQPTLVTDPNRNRSEVAFDTLGMVVATAVKGKDDTVGDTLGGFEPDLTQAQTDGFYDVSDPHVPAQGLLKDATIRIIYDLDRYRRTQQVNPADPTKWLPSYVATLARETHASDPLPPQGLKIQITFSYSDGFGREIQKKIQAEPGSLTEGGPVVSPRWVSSGWTIFNNKGKPVRQYEPFFSQLADKRHRFEFGVEVGISPILFYDPAERVIATLHPDDTYEKIVFTPWRQKTYDMNDTVAANGVETGDPRTDPDIKGYVAEYFKTKPGAWQTWHQQRITGAKGAQEKSAAEKAAKHANTPATAHLDTLGRQFLTVAHNGFQPDGTAIRFATRVDSDIEGNQREITDARGNVVMSYDYDMLSNRIRQKSTDGGARWMLNDVLGKPLYAWDSRDHRFRTVHDELRRPIESHMREGAGSELLIERTTYGESQTDPESNNLRGKVFEVFDQAGVASSDEYDFKGNLLRSRRRLAQEYKKSLNWSVAVSLELETFSSRTCLDALNRPAQLIPPHSDRVGATVNIIQPVYNEANMLEQVKVWLNESAEPTGLLDPATADLSAVADIDYNAKGQRTLIDYGNGATTTYEYDPLTFRLTNLKTVRSGPFAEDERKVQDLFYTYDPVGNITHIRDDAQQKVYFNNQVVEAKAEYTYDAIYRLIEATGREYLGDAGPPIAPSAFNSFHTRLDHPRDGKVMGSYVEQYVYDAVGNFLSMRHRGSDPVHAGWKRCYQYALDGNRLLSTSNPGGPHNPDDDCPTQYSATPAYAEKYEYDAHGNITKTPLLHLMRWDYRDQLRATAWQVVASGGTPETTYYLYDSKGQRVRKVTDAEAAKDAVPVRKSERIYIGNFEVYREYNGVASPVKLERETLHVTDDKQRIALVETRTQGDDGSPAQLIRYQLGNHLGSACLELNHQAKIISYEEYYPYGSTSYQAVRDQTEAAKRYRYTGRERDEESGLYYHGARYYACWLGRWASCDPIGVAGGLNLYSYALNNPLKLTDPAGTDPVDVTHVTPINNLPRIAAEGLQPGARGWWLGTGTYFNEASRPFASLGPASPVQEGDVALQTRVDTSGFRNISYSQWQEAEQRIWTQVRSEASDPNQPGGSLSGRGRSWQVAQVQARVRAYWNNQLSETPGAYMDYPGTRNSDPGRIYIVRPGFQSRISNFFRILGQVTSRPIARGSPWALNTAARSFVFTATTTAGTVTLSLSEMFIPGFAEARAFVQAGGGQWIAQAIRGFLRPPAPPAPPPAPPAAPAPPAPPAAPPAAPAPSPGAAATRAPWGARVIQGAGVLLRGLLNLSGTLVTPMIFIMPPGGFKSVTNPSVPTET